MKTLRRISYITIAVTLLLCSTLAAPAVLAAGQKGVEVTPESQDTKTMYYLLLPLKNKTLYLVDYNSIVYDNLVRPITGGGLKWYWNRFDEAARVMDNRTHTFIFTYNNITVNSYPVLTTWNIQTRVASAGGWPTGRLEITISEDIEINIRSEYYEIFQDGDFSSVTATYLYTGYGFLLHSSANNDKATTFDFSQAQLKQREVDPDYDPIVEEGQAPDNGGINLIPQLPDAAPAAESWWNRLVGGVGSTLDFAVFGGAVFGGVLFIALIFSIIRRR